MLNKVNDFHNKHRKNDKNFRDSFQGYVDDYLRSEEKSKEFYNIQFVYDFYITILYNIALLSYMISKRLKVEYVLFAGNFMKDNKLGKEVITRVYQE